MNIGINVKKYRCIIYVHNVICAWESEASTFKYGRPGAFLSSLFLRFMYLIVLLVVPSLSMINV